MSEERDDERQGTRRSSRWGNAGSDSRARNFGRETRDAERREDNRGSDRRDFGSDRRGERRDGDRRPYDRDRSSHERGERRAFGDSRRDDRRGYGYPARDGERDSRRYDSGDRGGYRGARRDDSRGGYDRDARSFGARGGRSAEARGSRDGGRRFERNERGGERRSFGGRDERGFRDDGGSRDGGFSRDRNEGRNFRENRGEGFGVRDDRGGRDNFSRGRDERRNFSDSRPDRGFDRRSQEQRGEARFGDRNGYGERGRSDERRPSHDRSFSRDERRGSGRFSNDRGFDRGRGSARDDRSFGEERRDRTDQNENVRGPRSWDGPVGEDGRTKRKPEPWISEEITGKELDKQIRQQLRTLSKENAEGVARHLVAATELLDVDPKLAFEHAEHAASRAGRVPAAREVLGLAYYRLGQYAEALREFRTARRLSGSDELIPLMVDCERGLGRYERALELANSPEASRLGEADNIELAIVVSGVRRDMGQARAALVGLRIPALTKATTQPWAARLFYAYADTLMDLDEREEAREWFVKAEAADAEDVTDAGDRIDEIDGFEMTDLAPEEDQKVDERFADFDLKQPFGSVDEAKNE